MTVYERRYGGPLQLMYWDKGQPRRESLTNLEGFPIFDRADAEAIAEKIAAGIKETRRAKSKTLNSLVGVPDRHTVGELFSQLHRDRDVDWSRKWASDQRRYRRFWEITLGPGTDITDVTPALISRLISKEARVKRWSEKTSNHYLNAAVETWGYAETYLKWIEPSQNLAAVRRHRIHVDNQDIAYRTDEAHRILAYLPDVDLRAAVAGELSYMGGRRINAIRNLKTACYRTEVHIVTNAVGESTTEEFGVVTFPAATDKARTKGEVYLPEEAKRLVETLLATPACQASGLLFPKLDLGSSAPPSLPITAKKLRQSLREAERLAGVPAVKGRSFHAFNRTFATDAEDARAASSQSGKTEQTMARVYRQPKPAEKAALAMQLGDLRKRA